MTKRKADKPKPPIQIRVSLEVRHTKDNRVVLSRYVTLGMDTQEADRLLTEALRRVALNSEGLSVQQIAANFDAGHEVTQTVVSAYLCMIAFEQGLAKDAKQGDKQVLRPRKRIIVPGSRPDELN